MKKSEDIIKKLQEIADTISEKNKTIEKTQNEINGLNLLKGYLEIDLKKIHFNNPQPGDFWHECYTPVMIVLNYDGENVTICENTISNKDDTYSFDLHKTKKITKQEFNKTLCYSTMPDKIIYGLIPLRCIKEVQIWKERQEHLASFELTK